jgi:deazaflavin-dependent oxidoreductase (nitroreductase family)
LTKKSSSTRKRRPKNPFLPSSTETAGRRRLVRSATKYLGALHRLLYRASGGRVGGRLWNLPVVLLTTTGRRTGKKRTVPLCSLPDGDDVVVIASYGGLDQPPAWWLNLEANPEAELASGRERHTVTARNAAPDERARLWAEVTLRAPGYLEYERRTSREIPVVILQSR